MNYSDYKICVGLPTGEFIHQKFFNQFYNLMIHSSKLVEAGIAHIVSSRIAYNRNHLVEEAKKFGATHILFIDQDSIVPSDALIKLINHEKEIACATTCHRSDEHGGAPIGLAANSEDIVGDDNLVEMAIVGLPLMLIDMKVFDKLQKPYFAEPALEDGTLEPEDAYFCRKVREAGVKIWCDMELSADVGHVGTKIYRVKSEPIQEQVQELPQLKAV